MSRYVIVCDDETASWVGNDVDYMRLLVCCCDCKHYTYADKEHGNNDWCEKHDHIAWSVNGFCAWGERKADA